MSDIQKWNFDTHEYEIYIVPDGKYPCLYSEDMSKVIDCASCFRFMTYGNGLTSRTLHNHVGLGYMVCDDCYNKEWAAELKSKEPSK